MAFGRLFEEHFLAQGFYEDRSIDQTLDLGWRLLSVLPKSELDRVDNQLIRPTMWKTPAVLRPFRGGPGGGSRFGR